MWREQTWRLAQTSIKTDTNDRDRQTDIELFQFVRYNGFMPPCQWEGLYSSGSAHCGQCCTMQWDEHQHHYSRVCEICSFYQRENKTSIKPCWCHCLYRSVEKAYTTVQSCLPHTEIRKDLYRDRQTERQTDRQRQIDRQRQTGCRQTNSRGTN